VPETPNLSWPVRALPVITIAGRFPLDGRDFKYMYRGVTHALHLHDYLGTIRMEHHSFALHPGDVTVSPARDRTWYDVPKPGHHWCIHFRPARTRGEIIIRLPWHLPAGAQRSFIADRIAEIARLHKREGEPTACAAAAVELQGLLLRIGMLATQHDHPPRRADAALHKLLRLLDEQFAETWTIPQLATAVGLTQDYLATIFRQRVGMTIPHYLLKRRIDHARQLLKSTDLPINHIAARVGMPDAQHFNKQFRRLVGMSPSQARTEPGRSGVPAAILPAHPVAAGTPLLPARRPPH